MMFEVDHVSKYFSGHPAVKEVSFSIESGESVGLVGESGCGKSTLALMLCRLLKPSSGKILWEGQEIWSLRGPEGRHFRSSVQIVFQNATASLNPFFSIGEIIAEPLVIHHRARGMELQKKVSSLLEEVGLEPHWHVRLPETLSGGQRQRVAIARALALEPKLILCDEPTSSLDVTIQSQILQLLNQLQSSRKLSLLFISHNLAVVGAIADRILVMDEGRIVEEGTNPDFFHHPHSGPAQRLVKAALQRI